MKVLWIFHVFKDKKETRGERQKRAREATGGEIVFVCVKTIKRGKKKRPQDRKKSRGRRRGDPQEAERTNLPTRQKNVKAMGCV